MIREKVSSLAKAVFPRLFPLTLLKVTMAGFSLGILKYFLKKPFLESLSSKHIWNLPGLTITKKTIELTEYLYLNITEHNRYLSQFSS